MKHPSYRFLFLDIGGVLLTNGFDHHSRNKAVEYFKLDAQDFKMRHDLIGTALELGKFSFEDYLDFTIFYRERPFSKDAVKSFVFNESQALDGNIDYFIELKQRNGLKVALTSNETNELAHYRVKQFGLERLADFFIFSGQVYLRKPDPEFYQLALHVAQCSADQVIYIDDRQGLIDLACKYFPLNGICYQSLAQTQEHLKRLQVI